MDVHFTRLAHKCLYTTICQDKISLNKRSRFEITICIAIRSGQIILINRLPNRTGDHIIGEFLVQFDT